MSLAAGRLRHRVSIKEKTLVTINPDTGEKGYVWIEVALVWAAIEPLSAREFIASQQMDSKVTARIVMRYRAGMHAAMRLDHMVNGSIAAIYNPEGFLADPDSGLEYLTVPVSTGVNDG
jgi:SPP1 family predicted phage head-tail adaptor